MGPASWSGINSSRCYEVNIEASIASSCVVNRAVGNSRLFDLVINMLVVGFASVYVIGSLWLADNLLSTHLPGYVFSGNYKLGIVIFFLSALTFIYWSRWREWNNWRFYALGPIAVFFPLVFVSSSLNVLLNPGEGMISSFSVEYCDGANSVDVCGKAFAAVVSSMSLRALPAVFTTPVLLYQVLLFKQHHFDRRYPEIFKRAE